MGRIEGQDDTQNACCRGHNVWMHVSVCVVGGMYLAVLTLVVL